MVTTSITAEKGRLFLLKVATLASPINYKTAGGLRTTSVAINGGPVDITNKGSAGWRELLPDAGVKTVDFTAGGVYDASNPQLIALEQAAIAGGAILPMEVVSAAGDRFVGEFAVATFNRSGNHNDAEMYEITLNSHGAVTYVPAV